MVCWRVFVQFPETEIGSWPVVYDDRDAEGYAAQRYNVLLYGLDRSLSNDEVTRLYLDLAKHRPDSLQAGYFAAFGEWLDINSLVSDPTAYANRQPTTISPEGEAKWLDLKAALESASVERRDLTADEMASLFNTGSNGVNSHRSYSQGVGGSDVLAIIWHLKSGTDVFALFRCGNPLIPGDSAPSIPGGPTDSQPEPPSNPVPDPEPPPPDEGWKRAEEGSSSNAPAAAAVSGQRDTASPGQYTEPAPLPPPHVHVADRWVEDVKARVGVDGSGHWECSFDGTWMSDSIPIPALPPPAPGVATGDDSGTISAAQD
jgi:hypothetical protein